MQYIEEKNAKKTRILAMVLTTVVFGAILGYLGYEALKNQQAETPIAAPASGDQALVIYNPLTDFC